ncbi:MAG TPA: amidase [Actinomycetota bacterium]|nr:amidase [Actinomycetota bacterium]
MTLTEARTLLASGALDPADLLAQCRGRIDASEERVKAWLAFAPGDAGAGALDPADRGRLPLWGIPLGIKDIIDVAGLPTTAASRVLAGAPPAARDAPAVRRLREAGALILGKTNTQEFAYGDVTPPTTNPWDAGRIPGGSSGGSAAAVAAGHCLGALGTDTAGSIRIPAALCALVGLKPRPGIVSLEGVIPLAPSFDTVGPLGRSVADVTVLWEVLSGATVDRPDAGELTVAAAPLGTLPPLAPEVATAYVDAVTRCSRLGRFLVRADIPAFADFDRPRSTVLMWEALQVHRSRGWWPDRRDAYTNETAGYLQRAETTLTEADADRARAECAPLAARLQEACVACDVLICPTVPKEAPTHAEAAQVDPGSPRRPVVMDFTRIPGAVNVAGLAALTIPFGKGEHGLPLGLQFIGRDEDRVLAFGLAFERATGGSWEGPVP